MTHLPTRSTSGAPTRTTDLQKAHLLEFGLEITQSVAKGSSTAVAAVACLFCKRLGRQDASADPRKRKRTDNIKYFGPPYRRENFARHAQTQHAVAFEEYGKLSVDKKETFFHIKKHTNSMHHYLTPSPAGLTIPISRDIVEVVIGDMFFNPELDDNGDDVELVTKVNALKLFDEQPDGSYVARVANVTLYNLVLQHTSVGLSFRQTSAVIGQHKDEFGNARLRGLNDYEVGKMVRVNVGANLQVLSDVLNDDEVWAFSLAGDGTTHYGVSYFDIRIRLCVRGVLFNVHLVCVPFFERHTAANICQMVCKLLDSLSAKWRSKLISISTDGENTMTGWIGGFVTLMDHEATNELLRIWCPPHQMDLIIRDATVNIDDGRFAKKIHEFTVSLRLQSNLHREMRSKCPKDTNRWAHFQAQLQWLLGHRVRLTQWAADRPNLSPPATYWVIAAGINPLAKACNGTLITLQHRDMVLSQQTAEIELLVQTLMLQVDIFQAGTDSTASDEQFLEDAQWRVTLEAVKVHVFDQGSAIKGMYLSLDHDSQVDVLHQIGRYALRLVKGLSLVQAERDYRNNAAAQTAPPVFPLQLLQLRTSQFIDQVLNPCRTMLLDTAWDEAHVDLIEQEHRELLDMIRSSPPLRTIVEGHTYKTMFDDAWDDLPAQPTLRHLRAFCGGLATAFANTTSVESDFSILKCEKDAFRSSLTALSVEGVFQTKQMKTIHRMLELLTPMPDAET